MEVRIARGLELLAEHGLGGIHVLVHEAEELVAETVGGGRQREVHVAHIA